MLWDDLVSRDRPRQEANGKGYGRTSAPQSTPLRQNDERRQPIGQRRRCGRDLLRGDLISPLAAFRLKRLDDMPGLLHRAGHEAAYGTFYRF